MRKRISLASNAAMSAGGAQAARAVAGLFAGLAPVIALIPGFRDQVLRVVADAPG